MKLAYEGSVKNLWEAAPDRLEFEYTDAYSVFDWGRMPDALARKGESLAALGAFFFEKASDKSTWSALRLSEALRARYGRAIDAELEELARRGLKHHFLKRTDARRLLVRRVTATPPLGIRLGSQTLHYNERGSGDRLLPLEVVFRFGVPRGSSLLERLTPQYARELGLSRVPEEGSRLELPVLEFFTKLEDTDRFLAWEQAMYYGGLSPEDFTRLVLRSLCVASWLAAFFGLAGLELWDGKIEWGMIDGKLALVDSIGPDELRLIEPRSGLQLSKELLRIFYRDTPWFKAMSEAKREAAADPSHDWRALTEKRAGPPPRLSGAVRDAADRLYPSLALAVTGENPGGLGVPLPELVERIRKW